MQGGQATGFHTSIYGAFSGANYLQSVTAFSDFSNTTIRRVGGFGGVGIADERAAFGSTELRERVEAGHSPGFVGVRLDGATSFGGFDIRPVVSVAYLHEFAPQRNLTNGFIPLPSAIFLVQGARPARNAAQTKIGAATSLGRNLSLFANFDGEFSGVAQVYGGKGGLRTSGSASHDPKPGECVTAACVPENALERFAPHNLQASR